MKTRWLARVLIAMFVLSVYTLAQKVKVDYDKTADFSKAKTYAWVKGTPAKNPNLDLYIMAAVDHDLAPKGLAKADPKVADLLITYHAATDSEVNATRVDDMIVAMSMGMPADATVIQTNPGGGNSRFIQKGSLALEMYDRKHSRPIWAAAVTVKIKDKRDEALDQLDKVVTKMIAAYPPR